MLLLLPLLLSCSCTDRPGAPDATLHAEACGDGILDPGEQCDPGISDGEGACPQDCASSAECISAALVGEGCAQRCEEAPITAPVEGDGCCPEGEDAVSDGDCEAVCGNGVVEPGELCDPESALEAERCPETCTSQDACVIVSLVGSDCEAHCAEEVIAEEIEGRRLLSRGRGVRR